MNPETINVVYDLYDQLHGHDWSGDNINELLGTLDTCVNTLNPDKPVWSELDANDEFVEFMSCLFYYCGLEAQQIMGIYCLDRGLVNCQMEFYEDIYDEYLCSEVLTYKRLIA